MAADLDAIAGSLAGRYTIERAVGSGGMATVYLAHDVRHDRPVALKVLHAQLAMAVWGAGASLREIQVDCPVAPPAHPAAVRLRRSRDRLVFYVMPSRGRRIAARTVRTRREAARPRRTRSDITREDADALDYAHGERRRSIAT